MAGGLRALLAARRLRVRLVVIARDGSVHYAGSFSKVLSPALRLGYLVVPDGLVDIFSAVKSIVNRYPPLFESAEEHLAGLLEVSAVDAGLQTVAWLAPGLDADTAARAAAARDLEVTPLSRYNRLGLPREGLQLGFAAVDEQEIRRGVRELAVALE